MQTAAASAADLDARRILGPRVEHLDEHPHRRQAAHDAEAGMRQKNDVAE